MAVTTREKILEIARSLPPAPRVFSDLDCLLRDTNSGLHEIGELIKRDATLAAHIIRLGNSVVYGGEQRTGSVEDAVARVGLQEIYRVVGDVAVARLADRALTYYGIEAEELREHMLHTALVCEHLAAECGLDARSAYTAGLMRPLGLLVLDRLADSYGNIEPYHLLHDGDYLKWEGRLFGFASSEVAAMVLEEWSFPAAIVDAVRNQYMLRSADLGHELACLLNLAGGLVADNGYGMPGETRHWDSSVWKLETLGLTEVRFRAAGERARKAYVAFKRRLRGEAEPVPEPVSVPAELVETAAIAASFATVTFTPEPARGAMAPDSSNFPPPVCVVQTNDDPPVHTSPSGIAPPADFTTFMRAYQDMVFSTAARLTNNEAQAEDISQEVFLKAHEHFDALRTSPTAGGWLKTVATNLSLNHLSRYRNRWKFFSELRHDDTAGDAPEVEFAAPDAFFSGVEAAERRAWVERALGQLPDHQRVPLVLHHFEELSYEDIAKKLGISIAKVKTDILRARAALAKILQRSGTEHEKIET